MVSAQRRSATMLTNCELVPETTFVFGHPTKVDKCGQKANTFYHHPQRHPLNKGRCKASIKSQRHQTVEFRMGALN